jgi:hypothetical protein
MAGIVKTNEISPRGTGQIGQIFRLGADHVGFETAQPEEAAVRNVVGCAILLEGQSEPLQILVKFNASHGLHPIIENPSFCGLSLRTRLRRIRKTSLLAPGGP